MPAMRGLAVSVLVLLLCGASPSLAQSAARWFLAEGASNGVLEEEILVANPSASALTVTVRLLPDASAQVATGTSLTRTFPLAATSRLTVRVAEAFAGLNGAASAEVSAVLAGTTTPADILVERSMYFPDGTRAGGHNASGVTQAAQRWILAEGASGTFSTFVLVANPNASSTTVKVTYLENTGDVVSFTATLPASSRTTFWPQNDFPAQLASAEFSTVVESLEDGKPIVAERAMYFDPAPGGSRFARSGHDALGVPAASTQWYFAEGFTGGNTEIAFETFLLLANTSASPTTATVTYRLDTGETVPRDYALPPNQRVTVWVDQEGRTVDPRLRANAFGISVTSPTAIVAERAMYWGTPSATDPSTPTFPWVEGHATAGSPVLAARWGFAEGAQDFIDASGLRYQTFLLFSNPNAAAVAVQATFQRTDGTGIRRIVCVPARGRANIWSILYPELSNQRFSAFVETIASAAGAVCPAGTAGGEAFVAERAMYWGAGYPGGHVNMGVPWTGAIAPPAEPAMTLGVTGLTLEGTQNVRIGRLSGGEYVTITGTNFTADTRVFFGAREATVAFGTSSSTTLRVLTPVRTPGTFGSAATVAVQVQRGASVAPAGSFTFQFRVLAIGDSFTEGQLVQRIAPVPPATEPTQIYSVADPPYPEALEDRLRSDVQFGATADVDNEGFAGECASIRGCSGNTTSGVSRIAALVTAKKYDVVIILEGFNDLNAGGSLSGTLGALRTMGRTAKASGATVLMGRIPVMRGDLYEAIRTMAAEEQFFRMDFTGVETGSDGIHPSQRGYHQMASIAYSAIKSVIR